MAWLCSSSNAEPAARPAPAGGSSAGSRRGQAASATRARARSRSRRTRAPAAAGRGARRLRGGEVRGVPVAAARTARPAGRVGRPQRPPAGRAAARRRGPAAGRPARACRAPATPPGARARVAPHGEAGEVRQRARSGRRSTRSPRAGRRPRCRTSLGGSDVTVDRLASRKSTNETPPRPRRRSGADQGPLGPGRVRPHLVHLVPVPGRCAPAAAWPTCSLVDAWRRSTPRDSPPLSALTAAAWLGWMTVLPSRPFARSSLISRISPSIDADELAAQHRRAVLVGTASPAAAA